MRKFTAAIVTAATAMSLSVGPAWGAVGVEKQEGETSSYTAIWAGMKSRYNKAQKSGDQEKMMRLEAEANRFEEVTGSAERNDRDNGYKLGTTFDILIGTGVAAVLLAVAGFLINTGMIPL